MIFFNLPLWDHIAGWPEVFSQTLLLSVILTYWVNHPKNKRLRVILLVGFILAMLLPILATHAAFGLFALGSWILIADKILLTALLDARWLIAIFVVGPLLAVMAVTFAFMVSSRVTDPRIAEQVSMVIIFPVLAGFFGQMAGLFVLNATVITWVAIVMLALDAGLVYLAVNNFQREQIFTRWK